MQKQEALDLIDSIAGAEAADVNDNLPATANTSSLKQRHVKETYDAYLKAPVAKGSGP